jgi:hypothetical protein
MTMRRIPSRFGSLFCNMVTTGMFLLAALFLWASVEGASPASEASPVGINRHEQGAIQLPHGMDPMDVVRTVETNRDGAAQNGLGLGVFQAEAEQGAAFQVGSAPAYDLAASNQDLPDVAFDGTNYLVVWRDSRNGNYNIYGARVSAGGIVLDPSGIAISIAAYGQWYPAVAFDGTNYLVVWEGNSGVTGYDIYGARVSTGGVVLDPGSIPISVAAGGEHFPAIAFDGTNYLVVWQDSRGGSTYDIYGARVSKGGSVLDASGIPISTALSDKWFAAVACDGTNYLVAWRDNRNGGTGDIYGARVSKGGSVLDPSGIAISTATGDQASPAIAFDGTNYLVVWQDSRGGPEGDIYGARVSVGGSVLDASGIPISTASDWQLVPDIAFDGTNYLVVWQDYRSGTDDDIYGARVSKGGSVLDASGIAISTATDEQTYPAVAFDATNYFVVWQDARNGNNDIYGARVSVGGIVLDPGGLTDLAFASASATGSNDQVTLVWRMTVDLPASSFRIERSETPDGEYTGLELKVVKDSQYSFSCVDHTVLAGRTYWYRILLPGASGEEAYGPVEARVESAPLAYRAYQSYPNPFNPMCTIRYEIPEAGRVSLRVFDASGSFVRALVDAWREPGAYSEVWNGRGDDGAVLPSGVYFYCLEAGRFVTTHKMVLLR